jgi:P-type Cu+ transporter
MSLRSQSAPRSDLGPAARDFCAYCGAPLVGQASSLSPLDSSAGLGTATRALRYCCYGCRVLGEAGQRPLERSSEKTSPWFKIAVGAVLAGQAMLLGLAVNLTPPAGTARALLHAALIVSSLAALGILGWPLLQSAFDEVRRRRVSIELLFLAGILGALGASLHSTLTGLGAVYYEVVAVLVTVYSIGKTLGAESRARALRETRHLAQTFDQCRKLQADGSEAMVRVAEIQAGDRVRVLAGEPIPIDGLLTEGEAFVCETPLTGEPFPVVRRPGDAVFAGSYSEDGELRIQAVAPGTARRLDGLLAALETARERPSRLQSQADQVVRWFLPLVLAVSLGTFLFWGLRAGWMVGLFNSLAVLLVACPCAMGLATPVALWNGLATLAARGFVARSGEVIDRLASLDRLVFDKTGTLSDERYSLIDLATAGSAGERQALAARLRAVQAASSHPVARAFQSPAVAGVADPGQDQRDGSALLCCVRSLKPVPALGVEAWVESGDGQESHLRVGRRELMTDLSPEPELLSALRQTPRDHLVYVEVDGRLRAVAAVRERVRESAAETLAQLRRLGIESGVMTGDRAEHAAALLDLAHIEGSLTPQAKAGRVAALNVQGCQTGFVGDGVNDAPALRAASLGIALAHGAGVTTAQADALLYGGDLRVLPWAVALARQVRISIRSNLVFAAFYNAIGMALAAAGLLHPVASALLMVVSSFTVAWRALRSTEEAEACCAPGTSPAKPPRTIRPWLVVPPLGVNGGPDRLKPALQASGQTVSGPPAVQESRSNLAALPSEGRVTRAPISAFQPICAILLLTQVPFLIYLGGLGKLTSLALSAVFLAAAAGIVRFRSANPELRRIALMTFAMLGPGNWGMILGWWADAGFAPVCAACHHGTADAFSLAAFVNMPWMNLGMVLLGLPPMLWDRQSPPPGLGRLAFGILSAFGMVWGMAFGSHAVLSWLGPYISQKFLLSLAGMTVGMLLGMFLFCEFGRALSLALFRRRAPVR